MSDAYTDESRRDRALQRRLVDKKQNNTDHNSKQEWLSIRPGDIFLAYNQSWFGRAVNAVQRFWAIDSRSEYSHAGIIIDYHGSTFESSWRVVSKNFQTAYAGKRVLIARHENMNDELFEHAFHSGIERYEGKLYPVHRLLMHIFPPFAKLSAGPAVCSELVAKFLYDTGLMTYWKGVNPDTLSDMAKHWKQWKVIFEGKLTYSVLNADTSNSRHET